MDDISAVDQLKQTVEALRLDGNVGLNVVGILMNTDMMGCGNVVVIYLQNNNTFNNNSTPFTVVGDNQNSCKK